MMNYALNWIIFKIMLSFLIIMRVIYLFLIEIFMFFHYLRLIFSIIVLYYL